MVKGLKGCQRNHCNIEPYRPLKTLTCILKEGEKTLVSFWITMVAKIRVG